MGQRFVISLTLSTDGCDHFRSGLAAVITSSIFLLVMMP